MRGQLLFSCELKPRSQHDNTLQKNKQAGVTFRWDSERLIISGPPVLGRLQLGEQVDRTVDLPPC